MSLHLFFGQPDVSSVLSYSYTMVGGVVSGGVGAVKFGHYAPTIGGVVSTGVGSPKFGHKVLPSGTATTGGAATTSKGTNFVGQRDWGQATSKRSINFKTLEKKGN